MNVIKKLLKPYKGLPKEIYIIFVAKIINAMGCFVFPLLTIILREKIGLSKADTGLWITISGALFVPAAALGGKLADMIGRKKVIVCFDMLAAILYIICGFMPADMNMIYVLLAASACMSCAGPAHDSLIADITVPENRSNAYALTYMGWNIGFAIGPALGGILYKKSLMLVFIGDAITALLSLMLIILFVKETIGRTKEEITDEKRVLEKQEKGSVIKVLLKRPILIYFALICFGYNFTYSQWGFMMPMHTLQEFGAKAGPAYYGFMASFNGIVVMLFTPLVVSLLNKTKPIRKMVIGGVLYAVGFGMLGVLHTLPFFFVAVWVFTLGEIVMSISTTPFIADHTPASHRGRMSAVMPMIYGAGYSFGPLIMGQVLSIITIETGWLALGLLTLGATYLMRRLEKKAEVDTVVEV